MAETKDAPEQDTPDRVDGDGRRAGRPSVPVVKRVASLPAKGARKLSRVAMRRPVRTMTVLSVLAAVLAAAVGAAVYFRSEQIAAAEARTEVVDAARAGVTKVLSYHYKTFDDDVDAAATVLTDDFRQQYRELMTGVVRQSARKDRTVTNVAVSRASVISASQDEAEALLFVNQTTTGRGKKGPELIGSRVRVTLVKSDAGEWRISAMKPL